MITPIWALWWIWGSAALVLGILEMLIPGYVFLGFAAGAVGVAGLLLVPGLKITLPVLLLIFAVMSLIAWLVFRRIFKMQTGSVKTFDHDIND
ncbi:MAG: hypothetical protein GJ676_15715 [Rhodobacteraceae bacterium]|nr:hypothetical protein [Paracoccaceae bacterium]